MTDSVNSTRTKNETELRANQYRTRRRNTLRSDSVKPRTLDTLKPTEKQPDSEKEFKTRKWLRHKFTQQTETQSYESNTGLDDSLAMTQNLTRPDSERELGNELGEIETKKMATQKQGSVLTLSRGVCFFFKLKTRTWVWLRNRGRGSLCVNRTCECGWELFFIS